MAVWDDHKFIYHYTTQAGLFGILENQTLHATHFKYLNDSSEMEVLRNRLRPIIAPHYQRYYAAVVEVRNPAELRSPDRLRESIEFSTSNFIDILYKLTFGIGREFRIFQPFIVAFCSHTNEYEKANGLLSQWRGYGRDSGYAIIFNTRQLWRLISATELKKYAYTPYGLDKVVYESDKDVFKDEFKDLADALNVAVPSLYGKAAPKDPLEPVFIPLTRALAHYKHQAYSEEREIRLIMSPPNAPSGSSVENKSKGRLRAKKIHFRENLVPYIIIFEKMNVTLPIERIIVGPHREKELRTEKLRRYLEMKGLKIDVHCSETPLV